MTPSSSCQDIYIDATLWLDGASIAILYLYHYYNTILYNISISILCFDILIVATTNTNTDKQQTKHFLWYPDVVGVELFRLTCSESDLCKPEHLLNSTNGIVTLLQDSQGFEKAWDKTNTTTKSWSVLFNCA